MQIVINITNELYVRLIEMGDMDCSTFNESALVEVIKNGIPLTPKVLADLLMEERITGELKQDVSYSKDVIDNVRCKLTVDIIDRRPCYCGAELEAVWRERKESEE